jgi:tRNA(Arg) A34 adenosine deaminase TadA
MNVKYRPEGLPESKDFSPEDAKFMQMAIDLSIENVHNGGGPFGAVVVRDGEVIATGVNRVTDLNDPTAHAEVTAIRNACSKVKDFKLTGATVYSSCEPCPMCLSALYWAGVDCICYGNTKDDASRIDFDDSFIYEQLAMDYEHRSIHMRHFMRAQAQEAFKAWSAKSDKIPY